MGRGPGSDRTRVERKRDRVSRGKNPDVTRSNRGRPADSVPPVLVAWGGGIGVREKEEGILNTPMKLFYLKGRPELEFSSEKWRSTAELRERGRKELFLESKKLLCSSFRRL